MGFFGSRKTNDEPRARGGLSIIAVGVTVRGDIESDGVVKIEGTVDGNVKCGDQVLVAKGGTVHGDIKAREAVVSGSVQGAIHGSERVEVQAGAKVQGDISTQRIAIGDGGVFNGTVRMGSVAPPAGQERPGRISYTPSTTPGRHSVPVARVAVAPRSPTGSH